jgi:hypothetical protein
MIYQKNVNMNINGVLYKNILMRGFSNKCYHVIKDGVYKVRKSFRVPRGKGVNVMDFHVGVTLDSLSP